LAITHATLQVKSYMPAESSGNSMQEKNNDSIYLHLVATHHTCLQKALAIACTALARKKWMLGAANKKGGMLDAENVVANTHDTLKVKKYVPADSSSNSMHKESIDSTWWQRIIHACRKLWQ